RVRCSWPAARASCLPAASPRCRSGARYCPRLFRRGIPAVTLHNRFTLCHEICNCYVLFRRICYAVNASVRQWIARLGSGSVGYAMVLQVLTSGTESAIACRGGAGSALMACRMLRRINLSPQVPYASGGGDGVQQVDLLAGIESLKHRIAAQFHQEQFEIPAVHHVVDMAGFLQPLRM